MIRNQSCDTWYPSDARDESRRLGFSPATNMSSPLNSPVWFYGWADRQCASWILSSVSEVVMLRPLTVTRLGSAPTSRDENESLRRSWRWLGVGLHVKRLVSNASSHRTGTQRPVGTNRGRGDARSVRQMLSGVPNPGVAVWKIPFFHGVCSRVGRCHPSVCSGSLGIRGFGSNPTAQRSVLLLPKDFRWSAALLRRMTGGIPGNWGGVASGSGRLGVGLQQ